MLLKTAVLCMIASVYYTCDAASSSAESAECEVITVHTCMGSSVIHKYTRVPTTRRVSINPADGYKSYRNQKRAMEGKRELVSRLKGRATKPCKAVMKPFVCAAYLPFCDENSQVVPPCQEFCLKAQTMCQDHYDQLGVEWPDDLDCSLFPTSAENPRCLSGLNINEPRITTLPSSADVEVKCNYDLLPRKRPIWLKNGIPVEEHSSKMQNVHVNTTSYSTLLVIKHFVDSVDGGNYTCAVGDPGNYEFERSISLEDIHQPSMMNTSMPPHITQEPLQQSECTAREIPCPVSDKCIPLNALCDGVEDCPSGMDETDCRHVGTIPPSGCPQGQISCPFGDACISVYALCNGIEDCPNGMDEMNCDENGPIPAECPPGHFPCLSGDQCVSLSAMCNGVTDCNDGYDEQCGNVTKVDLGIPQCAENELPCPLSDTCFLMSEMCDGKPDCEGGMDELNCPDLNSCLPIRVPQCSVGLDYKETLLGEHTTGISQDDINGLLEATSFLFNTSCGTFFRPFLCSTLLPPCGQRLRPPCRELCQVAIQRCVESFDGQLTEEDMMAQVGGGTNGGCDALPSQVDGQCYNVKEVSIGDMVASDSETSSIRHVDCTYNLLPKFQPKWETPSGSKVKTGPRRPIQVIHISDSVTRLQISQPDTHGVFKCSGLEFSDTIEF